MVCSAAQAQCSAACTCCIGSYCTPGVVGNAPSADSCGELYPDCATCADMSNTGTCDWAGCLPTCGLGEVGCNGESPNCTCIGGSTACGSDGTCSFTLPNLITVMLGLLFVPIGLAMALVGYRLWKYVVFVLGFLIIGVICAVIAYAYAAANGNTEPDLFVVMGFLGGGICGGFCFIAMYFIVIFCAGCGCGMGLFLALVVATGSATLDNVQLIAIGDVVFGIIVGIVFIYFQKICIMLGTAYLGSSLVWASIFYGIIGAYDQGLVQNLLVLVSTGGGFYVQWNFTAKGVEIDPRTGQVTVVIVPGQPAFLQRLDQMAGLQPGQAAPAVTAGVQWQQAPAIQAQPAWAQPPQGIQAPLLQAAPAAKERSWNAMSTAERNAVTTLGWTSQSWDTGAKQPFERSWDIMSADERVAAELVSISTTVQAVSSTP